jgi:hypothetical protein
MRVAGGYVFYFIDFHALMQVFDLQQKPATPGEIRNEFRAQFLHFLQVSLHSYSSFSM